MNGHLQTPPSPKTEGSPKHVSDGKARQKKATSPIKEEKLSRKEKADLQVRESKKKQTAPDGDGKDVI